MYARGMRALALFAAVIALASSATPYQQMGFRGGVTQTPLGQGAWLITAKGNGFTDRSTIVQYTYRRAAELCPDGFDVIDADRSTSTSVVTFDRGRTYQDVEKSEAVLAVRCHAKLRCTTPTDCHRER